MPDGYELLTDAEDAWFVRLGKHHEPFRLVDEVSGRFMMKHLQQATADQDTYESLVAFVVKDDRPRLLEACDDEDRPVTLAGAGAVSNRLIRRAAGRPFTRR